MMRVLIISPHFPPINAADMQRVRLLLPHLSAVGIEAEVIAIEPGQVAAPQDKWLEAGLPPRVLVHRVKALGLAWGRIPGMGGLNYRAMRALRRKGNELLVGNSDKGMLNGRAPFDLVYFSTTQFGIHLLGPEWKRRFGVPFVMDYQDPWVSDYYRNHPDVIPPGGRLKYGVTSWLSRRQEPKVLRDCSGITSVSAAYPEQLARRYQELELESQGSGIRLKSSGSRSGTSGRRPLPFIILPFPGDNLDIERARTTKIPRSVFDPANGKQHWVYVGRGGADMAIAVRSLFSAVAGLPSILSNLMIHFIGTSYAAAGRGVKTIEPLAVEYGLQNVVREHPDRIPYSETLRCLLDADALIVPGSDDPGYTASKIYPYLLADKPLLAIFHERSSVVSLLRGVGGGTAVDFRSGEPVQDIAARISKMFIDAGGRIPRVPLDEVAFAPHTACAQATSLAEFFHHCLR